MNDPARKPLTAEEIEVLLRNARQQQLASPADIVSSEPLGPGDVQHLQNMANSQDSLTPPVDEANWPYDTVSTDELLLRAQDHLAAAMSSESSAPDSGVAQFQPFPLRSIDAPQESNSPAVPISSIGKIEVDVSLELGHAELTIEQLLALREGSVVTLDRDAGDPIDILANGRLVARGEVIVIDDKFCIRVCEVIDPV